MEAKKMRNVPFTFRLLIIVTLILFFWTSIEGPIELAPDRNVATAEAVKNKTFLQRCDEAILQHNFDVNENGVTVEQLYIHKYIFVDAVPLIHLADDVGKEPIISFTVLLDEASDDQDKLLAGHVFVNEKLLDVCDFVKWLRSDFDPYK
ncbi:hypothetical protein N9L26_01555 [Candidatus Pacebacteria bacterium]|nr:hypothetical protein [Candidatus Paceibacterota bacterium]